MITLIVGVILIILVFEIASNTDFYNWNGWVIICVIIFIGTMILLKSGPFLFGDINSKQNEYELVKNNDNFYNEITFEDKKLVNFTIINNKEKQNYAVDKNNCEIVYDSTSKAYVEVKEVVLESEKWHKWAFEMPESNNLSMEYILHIPNN